MERSVMKLTKWNVMGLRAPCLRHFVFNSTQFHFHSVKWFIECIELNDFVCLRPYNCVFMRFRSISLSIVDWVKWSPCRFFASSAFSKWIKHKKKLRCANIFLFINYWLFKFTSFQWELFIYNINKNSNP